MIASILLDSCLLLYSTLISLKLFFAYIPLIWNFLHRNFKRCCLWLMNLNSLNLGIYYFIVLNCVKFVFYDFNSGILKGIRWLRIQTNGKEHRDRLCAYVLINYHIIHFQLFWVCWCCLNIYRFLYQILKCLMIVFFGNRM